MAWKCTWQVVCERCRKSGPPDNDSQEAEKKAKATGWLKGQCFGMALHLCPDCVKKGLPDWWPDATGLRFHWEDEAAKAPSS